MASIPSQELELTQIAKREGLKIVDTYRETQSAHTQGRPLFSEMLERIDKGEAEGIFVWNANRIARNVVDGGMVIEKMDQKKILVVKTKEKCYSNNTNDKFFLLLEFGIAKKFSDDLSDIVKRGNRYKFFERKEWAGVAKPGYVNKIDEITKKGFIEVDTDRFNMLKEAARMIITGKCTPMEALHILNTDWKYKSRRTAILGGKSLSRASFYRFLADPFYYGLMVRNMDNKICTQFGNHTTMFTKEEFDTLQLRLGKKGKHPLH